ncbi:hypothetical protein FI667_g13647, partial [Globisporangium splendens]
MKVWIYVEDAHGVSHRICWFMGTSDAQIETAVRVQLRLPRHAAFLVRDADGDLVPISSTLPHDQYYTLVLAEHLVTDEDGSNGTALSPHAVAHGTTSHASVANALLPQKRSAASTNHSDSDGIGEISDTPTNGVVNGVTHGGQHDATGVTIATAAAALIPDSALVPVDIHEQQQPKKRRQVAARSATLDGTSASSANDSTGSMPNSVLPPSVVPSRSTSTATTLPTRTRSIANIVTQFLETFTRPIRNDDNINFIPNTGKYALYALYSAIVTDPVFHPKGQDAFYKMTSMQGKVDRQRVIRYYQDMLPSGHVEYVQYKPQGKGPFLRRYCVVESEKSVVELVKKATFVTLMDLVPEQVVATYLTFVKGFLPISKNVYQAHLNGDECFLPGP